jgi:hypothetical protein
VSPLIEFAFQSIHLRIRLKQSVLVFVGKGAHSEFKVLPSFVHLQEFFF